MRAFEALNPLTSETYDVLIIDSLSHACIVDGALLASRGKQFRVYRHNDMDSLEAQLKAANTNRIAERASELGYERVVVSEQPGLDSILTAIQVAAGRLPDP